MPVLPGGGGGAGVATLGGLIAILRANCGDRPAMDTVTGTGLGGAVLIGDTVLTLASGAYVQPKTILDFDDGSYESALVQEKPTTTTADVIRGSDSAAGAHTANATVRVAPRYRASQYREGINQALRAIGYSFGRSNWDTSQAFSSARIIPVPADTMRPPDIWVQPSTSSASLKRVPSTFMRTCPAQFSATGKAVKLIGGNPGTGTAFINYEDAWPALDAYTDTLDADFPQDAYDLILLGAEAWLQDSDLFSVMAYQEPHIKARQFGSQLNDVRLAGQTTAQRFIQRRSEVAATRPKHSPAWLRG